MELGSTLWKSAMLITDWNAATRALPVLHLKANYLDRWPNWGIRDPQSRRTRPSSR